MTGLRISGISKTFGQFAALSGIDLEVRRGERRAVIGPNGAGKSTLFAIIGGQTRPSAGRIEIDGVDVTGRPPQTLWRHGLTRTFQRNQLFPGLTVYENVRLACIAQRGLGARMWTRIDRFPGLEDDVVAVLEQVRLEARRGALVLDLAYGEHRQLELALALTGRPRYLLLDEPTAGMSPGETESMISLLSSLPRDVTLLIVEHDMDVIFALADSATVLHLGKVLAEGTPDAVQRDPRVVEVYLGQEGAPQ